MAQTFNETLVEALNRASFFLAEHGKEPAQAQNYWLYFKEWSLTELVKHLHEPVNPVDIADFSNVLQRIVNNEPIQYVLGRAYFMDEKFEVTPATLIPRQETEGVVHLAQEYLSQHPKAHVLDIGTGTGIIAIMLAKQYLQATVTATDISDSALEVAQRNSEKHQVTLNFHKSDLTQQLPKDHTYSLIVSNPPYIDYGEQDLMDDSVKQYEPEVALYADNQGLSIYIRLAEELPVFIQENGMIVLEIGYNQGKHVQKIFQMAFPKATVSIQQDFNHIDRYIIVKL